MAAALDDQIVALDLDGHGTHVAGTIADWGRQRGYFASVEDGDTFGDLGPDAAPVLAADYSDTLDGGPWKAHRLLPEGGTPVALLRTLRRAAASFEFGASLPPDLSAAAYLEAVHGVPRRTLALPIGIGATDAFMDALSELSGSPMPRALAAERGRAARPEIKLGICGEHGGDPASIAFCEQVGLDYVSASPYRVPIARLAAAQASLR